MNKGFLIGLLLTVTTGLFSTAKSYGQGGTGSDSSTNYTVQKLYTEFLNPWGMAWLPDGRMLVTERAGEILVFKNDKFTGEKLSGVPEVFNQGQGGLLDIKLHPDSKNNGWIYITYSK